MGHILPNPIGLRSG